MTPFAVGDRVHVRALGTGTVREARSGGRVLVDIKGRALLVPAADLSPVEDRGRRRRQPAAAPPADDPPSRSHAAASVDLHGLTTDEAVTALDGFIDTAILAGLAEVRVIHGRSGGRLRAAVHARLRGIPSIHAFRLDPANPGVTIVTL